MGPALVGKRCPCPKVSTTRCGWVPHLTPRITRIVASTAFRFNYDYAGGQVTNFGAHSLDMAQWGLGMDNSGPVEVEHVYADYLPEGSLFNAATYTHFRCNYDNGVVLECMTGSP